MIQPSRLQGVFETQGRRRSLWTRNLDPGKKVYEERLFREGGIEYREWNPKRSKLAAGIMKGISQIGIRPGSTVLYLGASSGTTVSHVSDILGEKGFVFAIDFAPTMVRELVFLSESRPNIAPILGDASHPETYLGRVFQVDVVFQDIAQRNQVKMFLTNVSYFLKVGGFALLSVKSRSVDVTKKPRAIFREVKDALEKSLTIVDYKELDPLEKDHCLFVCKK